MRRRPGARPLCIGASIVPVSPIQSQPGRRLRTTQKTLSIIKVNSGKIPRRVMYSRFIFQNSGGSRIPVFLTGV